MLLCNKKKIFLSAKTNFTSIKIEKPFQKVFCFFSISENTKRNRYFNTVFDNAIMMSFYATIKKLNAKAHCWKLSPTYLNIS